VNDKKVVFSIEQGDVISSDGAASPIEPIESHQLFCQMDELSDVHQWKECARWIKFEEDVEIGGRWSKPYVATLSLHALLELRSYLTNGAILLDSIGDDLPSIVGKHKTLINFKN
jgi:hypothetical protein